MPHGLESCRTSSRHHRIADCCSQLRAFMTRKKSLNFVAWWVFVIRCCKTLPVASKVARPSDRATVEAVAACAEELQIEQSRDEGWA